MPKHTSYNRARAKKEYHAWACYGELTLVKQSGLWGSNIPGRGMDCLVWVPLLLNLSHLIWVFVKVSVFHFFFFFLYLKVDFLFLCVQLCVCLYEWCFRNLKINVWTSSSLTKQNWEAWSRAVLYLVICIMHAVLNIATVLFWALFLLNCWRNSLIFYRFAHPNLFVPNDTNVVSVMMTKMMIMMMTTLYST